jgi:hypothetical protein
MRSSFQILIGILLFLIPIIGCSNNNANPFAPENPIGSVTPSIDNVSSPQTHLWGFYDCYFDLPSKTISAILNRNAMFATNVVNFLNKNAAGLAFKIYDTPIDPGGTFIDVDIDVKLTHPFPGMSQYNGYDVRGIFMGNGSSEMAYNPDLIYAAKGTTDQVMYDYDLSDSSKDPYPGLAGLPDGYTRWWNPTEFSTISALFGYTPGKAASPGYTASGTLNPYKYFADDLSPDDNLWSFLGFTTGHGVFSSGHQNTRNYYLRFPTPNPGIKFSYAVVASWKGTQPADHPANQPEAVGVSVNVTPDVYYVNPSNNGGNLILDISVFDWDSVLSAGKMEDYNLIIESSVLSSPATFSSMIPTVPGSQIQTYHLEIPADNVVSPTGNEFWVIIEDQNNDYTNPYGIVSLAGYDKLAAFFRYNLPLKETGNTPPVISGITDDIAPDGLNAVVSSSNTAVTYSVNYTDPDVGQDHTIKWYIEDATVTDPSDPPDTMPFNWSLKTSGNYKIWVKVNDGFGDVQSGPYNIGMIGPGWARTWGGSGDDEGRAVAIDSSGYIYVAGYFNSNVDFDPGAGTASKTSTGPNGWSDCYLSKFDPGGNFQWVQAWSGTVSTFPFSIVIDSTDNAYVLGVFSDKLDVNPSPSIDDFRTSAGSWDIFLTKFNSSGTWLSAITIGGTGGEMPACLSLDGSDNVYVTGMFQETADFDPSGAMASLVSKGSMDCFVAKYNSSLGYIWVRGWGGTDSDRCEGVAISGSDAVYTTGTWNTTVNFDPYGSSGGPYEFTSNGASDVFLSKFNLQGDFQWAKTWGGTETDMSGGVAADAAGGAYVAGGFYSQVDLDPGAGQNICTPVGGWDTFISKFDTSGNFSWGHGWGGTNADEGYFIASDSAGNAYVEGRFEYSAADPNIDFNPDPGKTDYHVSAGGYDAFINVFNPDGDQQWASTWGGTNYDECEGVIIDSLGVIYATGMFSGTADFDPGPGVYSRTSYGTFDAALLRLLPGGQW